jgi:hypothetical protein
MGKKGAEDGYGYVGARSGKGDQKHASLRVLEIPGIDRNRFGPADFHDDKGENTQRVKMFQGVHGQAPLVFCGGVTQPVSNIPVRQFMHGDGEKEGRRQKDQLPDNGMNINVHGFLTGYNRFSVFLIKEGKGVAPQQNDKKQSAKSQKKAMINHGVKG